MAEPPVASAEHEPVTSDATGTPQRPIWKKREGSGQELFDYVQTELYPEYVAWTQLPKAEKGKLNHKQWIRATMWPKVDEKYKISGENGYNIADFLEVRHILLPTARGTQEPTKIKKSTKPVQYKTQIKEQVAKEYGGEKSEMSRDGVHLTRFNETATQMFAAVDATMKAQMETKAAATIRRSRKGRPLQILHRTKGRSRAWSPAPCIPSLAMNILDSAATRFLPFWGIHRCGREDSAFHSFHRQGAASSKLFKDPSKQTEIEFKKWAMAELSPSLPDVDVTTLSADEIRQILRKFSSGTKITIAVSNNESEAQDIDEANLEDLRRFYTSALHLEREKEDGKKGSAKIDTPKPIEVDSDDDDVAAKDFSPPLVKYSAVVATAAAGVVAAHGSPLPIVIPDGEQGGSGSQCGERDEGGADAEDDQVSAGGPGGRVKEAEVGWTPQGGRQQREEEQGRRCQGGQEAAGQLAKVRRQYPRAAEFEEEGARHTGGRRPQAEETEACSRDSGERTSNDPIEGAAARYGAALAAYNAGDVFIWMKQSSQIVIDYANLRS
ncbi:hypothetical protein B0H10DRAFT_1956191 [Mycena sp. CBHHK59/15]|nr:hypothetical protein B0H10DRAFT_1956191 [Mycena sp. CBHHK59/15]